MSNATGIPETSLLAQIEDLIENQKITGKIDLIDMVSFAFGTVWRSAEEPTRCSISEKQTPEMMHTHPRREWALA